MSRRRFFAPVLSAAVWLSASASADLIPPENFDVPDDLEVTVWATSPSFYNPTNMDVDQYGRIWVAEAVNYRKFKNKGFDVEFPEGDRVVWLQDTDGDGKADKSQVFVQDKDLVAPLGISVIDNRILVAAAPHMVQYTDVDRNGIFDPGSTRRNCGSPVSADKTTTTRCTRSPPVRTAGSISTRATLVHTSSKTRPAGRCAPAVPTTAARRAWAATNPGWSVMTAACGSAAWPCASALMAPA